MILGWILKKRTLPIIYSQKTLNVIKDVKLKDKYVFCEKLTNFDYEKYYNDTLCEDKNVDIELLTNTSNNHFTLLDQLLD